jgi:hypothetical protein
MLAKGRSWPVFSLKLRTFAFLFWADLLFLLIRARSLSPWNLYCICFFTRDLTAALIRVLAEWNDILLGGSDGCFLCEPSLRPIHAQLLVLD